MAAWMNHGGTRASTRDLLLVDGMTGRGRPIVVGTPTTAHWVVSPKGPIIARVDYQVESDVYRIYVPTSEDKRGDFKVVFREETKIPDIAVHGATSDEKHLIVSGRKSNDRTALFKLSLETGALEDAIFEHNMVDTLGVESDPYTGAIVGARYVIDSPEQVFFESDLQNVLLTIRKALPGKVVNLTSWSKDRKKFIVHSEGEGDPGTYFVFDVDASRMSEVGRARKAISPADMARVTPLTFKARDGLTIHAFLTLPPGQQAKQQPLVVLPHGGPAARDSASFDYWAQFLASRGYGVLQVNFRGSIGYGKTFEDAGDREWGAKMQDDITDGVKHVIEEGIADPTRICIVGSSYGGYAALAGAAFTPELYKCAASIAGISDLKRMLAWQRNAYGFDSSVHEYSRKVVGDPDTDGDLIRARSPVNSVDKITAAVMLIHGTDDTVVDFDQSEIMADALEDAGKPFEFIELEGEDHWNSKPKTRIEMLKALEAFLAKHLGA